MNPKKGDLTKFHRDMVTLCGLTSVDSDGCIHVFNGDAAVLQDSNGEAKMLYIAGDDIDIPCDALVLNLFTNGKQSLAERSWFFNNRDKELALLMIKLMLEVMNKAYEAKASKDGSELEGDIEFINLVTPFAGVVSKKTIKSFKSLFKLKKGSAHKDMGELVRIVFSKKHKRSRLHCIFTDVGAMRKAGVTKKDAEIIRDVACAVLPGLEEGITAESTAISTAKLETHVKLYTQIIPHFQKFSDVLDLPLEVTEQKLKEHLEKLDGLSAVASWVKTPGSSIASKDDYENLMEPTKSDFAVPAAPQKPAETKPQVNTQAPPQTKDIPWWEQGAQQAVPGTIQPQYNGTFAGPSPQQHQATGGSGAHWSEQYVQQTAAVQPSLSLGFGNMTNFSAPVHNPAPSFGGNGVRGFS